MVENLKAFRDEMERRERRSDIGEQARQADRPSQQVRSAVEAGNARYQGYIATINNMRDRDIERALAGR